MTIPALSQAKADKALRGNPIIVYLHLLDELDPMKARPVKQAALAKRLEVNERTIRTSIATLVKRGYLQAEPKTPGEARSYRLVYSMAP